MDRRTFLASILAVASCAVPRRVYTIMSQDGNCATMFQGGQSDEWHIIERVAEKHGHKVRFVANYHGVALRPGRPVAWRGGRPVK